MFECYLEYCACLDGSTVTIEVTFPPKVALARLVNSLKGVSSRLLRKEFPELDGYCQDAWLWSGSYYAGTGTGTPPGAGQFAARQSQAPRWPPSRPRWTDDGVLAPTGMHARTAGNTATATDPGHRRGNSINPAV